MSVVELLKEILCEFRLQRKAEQSPSGFDWNTLLSLPDHLRKTALVLAKQGCTTAEEVSIITHRARAVESAYLNQLVIYGLSTKERKGRKVYFQPKL